MAKDTGIDEEPLDSGGNQSTVPIKKSSAYQKLKRDLSEEELNSAGALKLVLNDLDRLNDEVVRLEKFRADFHLKDKQNAILEEKLKTNLSKEVLYSVTITLGSTLMGLCPGIWAIDMLYGIVSLACGVVLLFGGVITKFFWK